MLFTMVSENTFPPCITTPQRSRHPLLFKFSKSFSPKNNFPSVENVAYLGQQDLTFSTVKANGTTDKYLEKEAAAFTDAQYFHLFDYQWLVGNPALLNTPNSVMLTEKYAKKYFGDINPSIKSSE